MEHDPSKTNPAPLTPLVKNVLLHTDGTVTPLEDGELPFATMYKLINCDTIEVVRLDDTRSLYCDENGLAVEFPLINLTASAFYRNAYPDIPPEDLGIVGDVVYSYTISAHMPVCPQCGKDTIKLSTKGLCNECSQ
jgi:hypothetical protein